MQKALRHPEGLRILVGIWFQVLFHRPSGLLFTFPSRYLFAIDDQMYLAFGHSRPCFLQDFTCPVVLTTYNVGAQNPFSVWDYHPLWLAIPGPFL